MGCFDGAEMCEIVGTYILNQRKEIFQHHSFGLNRDNGFAVAKSLSGLEIKRMKKKINKIFKDCRLKITIKGDLRIVIFLDVTFSLHKNTYELYRNRIPPCLHQYKFKPPTKHNTGIAQIHQKKVIRILVQ